jgi:CheY-like chemotaxis protein
VGDDPKPNPHHDVSGALHDASNALTVLLGWISEARAKNIPEEQREHALAVIERQARIARSIARRAIGAESAAAEGSADGAISDVLESLSALGQKRHVVFEKRTLPKGTVPRVADFGQVLTNLCLNALAFTPDHTTVSVTAHAEPHAVVVLVQDEGEGIPPTRWEDIWSGETTRSGGAGVGLRYARSLAQGAGGDLQLVQTPPGAKGACFRMEWPRTDRVPKAPMSFSGSAVLAARQILLVEDDDDVIELVETALMAKGAEITVARKTSEVETALSALATAPTAYDCAVVDLSPLGADPTSLLGRLLGAGLPLVLITGNVDGVPELRGDVRVVRKPFEVKELVDALTILLQVSRR